MKIHIGSRGSLLALTQTKEAICKIKENFPNLDIELIIIKTTGDKDLSSFEKLNTIGIFIKEIEEALLKNKIDIAVHSLKDLPIITPKNLALGAVLKRVNYQDIMVSAKYSLDDLPEKAVIGTSSLRRRIQIMHVNPNLRFVQLRGNMDTRLKKLTSQNLDAIICAHAALIRLNILDDRCHIIDNKYISYSFTPLPKEIMLPAAGQGIIGMEFNLNNEHAEEILKTINHNKTFHEAFAERQFLSEVGGGCIIPAGALAEINGNQIELEGFHADEDGANYRREKLIYPIEKMNIIGKDLADRIRS